MKLSNLSIVFVIIFLSLVFTYEMKNQVSEKTESRKNSIERACNEGAKAAGNALAEELYLSGIESREVDSQTIIGQFYQAGAENLGIGHMPDCRERLERVVPIIAILKNESFEISYPAVVGGKLCRFSTGFVPYGQVNNTAALLESENRCFCINKVEEELSAAINSVLKLYGEDKSIEVDIPEYAYSGFVQTISGPSIIGVALIDNPVSSGMDIKVCGAGLCKKTGFYEFAYNDRKEFHTETCEKVKTLIEQKKYTGVFETEQEALDKGCEPQTCCNPLGAYIYNYMSGK